MLEIFTQQCTFFPLTVWIFLLNYFLNLNTTQHSEKLNLIIRQSAKEKKPDCSGCMFELNIDKVASESVCLRVRKTFVLRDGQQIFSWDGNGKRSNERKTSIRERKSLFSTKVLLILPDMSEDFLHGAMKSWRKFN